MFEHDDRAAEDPLAGTRREPDDAEVAALEDEMAELSAHINAAQARLLELICKHDQQRLWARSWGIRS